MNGTLAIYGRSHAVPYVIANVIVPLAVIAGSMAHPGAPGQIVYTCLLFAMCSTPLLLLRALNDRHALLGIFMGLYFLFFGALDLQHLVFGSEIPVVRTAFLSGAEIAILLGAILVQLGYVAGVRLSAREGRADNSAPPADWPQLTILAIGIVLWLLGSLAMLYFQVFAAPEKTNHSVQSAFSNMGPLLTFIVMLGNMMQPVGILILAYGYAKYRGSLWFALIVTVVLLSLMLGFVTDVKRVALLGPALVIMTRTLVDNRLPKVWIACSLLGLALVFPVFQAYRAEITGERGLDRLQAFRELPKVLEIALASRDKVTRGEPGERSQTFLERSSVKESLETLFEHVGRDVPLLHGATLVALPMAFVPRLLVPEKADVSVGQLFTKQVLHSEDDTYISISNMGELYWNYGWPGALGGMALIGLLLGWVGGKFNLERGTSVTRVIILLATTQTLCMGFEGTVPVAYIIWLRSMAAIGIMHLAFARSGAATSAIGKSIASEVTTDASPEAAPGSIALPPKAYDLLVPRANVAGPRFPNLMR